ncbi:MAG: YlxR family protein [Eubacteriaceae bacterium]|nr:YlxR family protein [Eubacteriaceae bacterium]
MKPPVPRRTSSERSNALKKQPMRTCVMCRQKREKRELVRIVRTPEGEIKFDPTGKANGRGCYVCTSEECLSSVKNVSRIARALETAADAQQLNRVYEEIISYVNQGTKGEK